MESRANDGFRGGHRWAWLSTTSRWRWSRQMRRQTPMGTASALIPRAPAIVELTSGCLSSIQDPAASGIITPVQARRAGSLPLREGLRLEMPLLRRGARLRPHPQALVMSICDQLAAMSTAPARRRSGGLIAHRAWRTRGEPDGRRRQERLRARRRRLGAVPTCRPSRPQRRRRPAGRPRSSSSASRAPTASGSETRGDFLEFMQLNAVDVASLP